jgi:twinkle protein
MSSVVGRLGCPKCGSRDNVALYDDGGQHCFTPGCNYHVSGSSSFQMTQPQILEHHEIDPILGSYQEITSRRIPKETSQFFGYFKGVYGDSEAFFWPIFDKERRLTGYKIRKPNKQFVQHGSNPDHTFLGQEKWSNGGKLLVIFEGEYDCLAYAAVRKTWACVSLPNGADSAEKSVRSNLDWLLKFEEVILCFDNDEHGQKAAKKAVQLLPPRKGKIGVIEGYKDASDALVDGNSKAIMQMVWTATEYEPDGIVSGSTLLKAVLEDPKVESVEYPYSFLNEKLHGLRKGELVTVTAGTGIGKSTFVSEIAYDLLVRQGETVGYVALEENIRRTARRFVGMELDYPIHIDRGYFNDEQIEQAFEKTLGTGRLFLYDHFGSLDPTVLLNRVRHLVSGCGCNWIIFDHLSILVSGLDQGDERRAIDQTMTKLRSFVEETNCGMLLVSHLRRPQGDKGHENGAQTSLSQLRGSHSISQLSDVCIGLERDQQTQDCNEGTTVRVLKNRFTGWCGVSGQVNYNENTGRMLELKSSNTKSTNLNDSFETDF